jgi:hypothetical protein
MRPISTVARTPLPPLTRWLCRDNRLPSGTHSQASDEPQTGAESLGFMGLQVTLAGYQDDVPAATVLLAGMIHAMGGAPTSVASGTYLNFRI